jgi:membrane protein
MTSIPRSATPREDSIWRLGGLSLWNLARDVIVGALEDHAFERASGLAFDFLFALIPLLVSLLTLFSLFAARSSQLQNELLTFFADFLPSLAFQLLNNTTRLLATNPTGEEILIGFLAALWFAARGVSSMISSLNVVYRAKESRSWFRVRAIAALLTLVISTLVLSSLGILLVGGSVVDWVGKELHLASAMVALWKALQWPGAVLFMLFSYALIYSFGPNVHTKRWQWITPGSVFGVIVWLAVSEGFRIYLRYVNSYTLIYGSLGGLMILMVWLYVTALAFLIGGEINARIERARARIHEAERVPLPDSGNSE